MKDALLSVLSFNNNSFPYVFSGQVGLLQNTTYAQDDTEMKDIAVASGLTDEESNDNSNMLTITGEDGLVYQVRVICFCRCALIYIRDALRRKFGTWISMNLIPGCKR